jgi:ubiquinone/menaquinone biosynthesis C-methylase UbiE
MSQKESGLYQLLNTGNFYNLIQDIIGRQKAWDYVINRFIVPENDNQLLDIGCGTADILNFLPESVSYTGFDFNEKYINTAKKRYGNKGKFILKRVDEYIFSPEEKEQFDIVIVIGVLHHLSLEENINLLEIAHWYLKKGGRICIIEPVYHENQHWFSKFIISLDRGKNVMNSKGYENLFEQFGKFSKIEYQLRIPYSRYFIKAFK